MTAAGAAPPPMESLPETRTRRTTARRTSPAAAAGGAGARASSSSSEKRAVTRRSVRESTKRATAHTLAASIRKATQPRKASKKPDFSHLGTPIRYEDLEPGKRYVARHIDSGLGPKHYEEKQYEGSTISGIFIKSKTFADADSGKPYVGMSRVKEHDGYIPLRSAYVLNKETGKLMDLPMVGSVFNEETLEYEWPRGVPQIISDKHPDIVILLASTKWVFYPYEKYNVNRLRNLMPAMADIPDLPMDIIARMAQPDYKLKK